MTKASFHNTVSLEWALNLRDAGFPQQAELFYDMRDDSFIWDTLHAWDWNEKFVAMPTAEEIWQKLPSILKVDGEPYALHIAKVGDYSTVYYLDKNDNVLPEGGAEDRSLANAVAEMWVFLKKRGLIK